MGIVGERERFLRETERADRLVRTLCMTRAYAGCRLFEALALIADRVDVAAGVLVFETGKARISAKQA
jgi:integrase/recombinase XerD